MLVNCAFGGGIPDAVNSKRTGSIRKNTDWHDFCAGIARTACGIWAAMTLDVGATLPTIDKRCKAPHEYGNEACFSLSHEYA